MKMIDKNKKTIMVGKKSKKAAEKHELWHFWNWKNVLHNITFLANTRTRQFHRFIFFYFNKIFMHFPCSYFSLYHTWIPTDTSSSILFVWSRRRRGRVWWKRWWSLFWLFHHLRQKIIWERYCRCLESFHLNKEKTKERNVEINK